MLGCLRDRARHPRQYFGWPRRAKRGRPITHEWIDPWTLLLPGQHRWAQVGATGEPREFRLARSRQDKRLERAIPLTTHLWFGQGILERIGLLTTGTGVLGKCDVNGKIISQNYFLKNLWTVNFHFIDPENYLHIMRTFLNHIKNETLDEIKTSLENLWQRMIQLSEFFQYSFVLILKRKCLVLASRVRCWESGTPSTIIYTQWSSRRYELGCDAPVATTYETRSAFYRLNFWQYWFVFICIHKSKLLMIRLSSHTIRRTKSPPQSHLALRKYSSTKSY